MVRVSQDPGGGYTLLYCTWIADCEEGYDCAEVPEASPITYINPCPCEEKN